MRRCRHRCHLFQEFQVLRMLAELVIANQRAKRLAAENPELFFVNFLEQPRFDRIPGRAGGRAEDLSWKRS